MTSKFRLLLAVGLIGIPATSIMKDMAKLRRVLFWGLFVLAFTTPTWAQTVVNGGFEADIVTLDSSVAGGGLTGWTVGPSAGAGYPYLINNAYGASTPYGNQFITLGYYYVGGTDYIQQTISGFTIGGSYDLSFALATELGPGQSQLEVSFPSGSSTAAADFTALTSGAYWLDWSLFTDSFVATGNSVTVRFTQLAGTGGSFGGYDVGLDNVSISQSGGSVTPEPASLLLMGTGFLAIVAQRRRQRCRQ